MANHIEVLTYDDLPFCSKFFYSDGSEDLESSFPDETRQNPQVENRLECCQRNAAVHTDFFNQNSDFTLAYPTLKILETKIALEAACGDSTFLVS